MITEKEFNEFNEMLIEKEFSEDDKELSPEMDKYFDEIFEEIDGEENEEAEPKVKAEYIQMSLDDLIAEHKKLVEMLEKSGNAELEREAIEQKAELEKYIEMRQGEFKVGDAVKIVSGSKDHLGRIGYIAKVLNNGKEDYYEVRMGDMGLDLCFAENIKKINNPNTIPDITQSDEEQPKIKSDEPEHKVGIVAAFEKMKEDLLKRIELEDGTL
jgi:hypothetical protein